MRSNYCWKNVMASTKQRLLTTTLVSFTVCVIFVRLCYGMGDVANVVYMEAKNRSKEMRDIVEAKLDDVDDNLRQAFKAMEEVCHRTFLNPKVRVLNRIGMTVDQSARTKRGSSER
jgi:hypothetical protein